MALMTISEVSERLGISPRMLRYYEKEGMIESRRRENYAYRVYDEYVVERIRQIVLLRKLQMPLRKIRVILDGSRQEAVRVIQEQIADTEQSAASMETIHGALCRLSEWLQAEGRVADCGWESVIEDMTGLLSLEKYQLNGSSRFLWEEKEKHIRIVLLPPCTVASYGTFGVSPEEAVGSVMDEFVRREGLYMKKPDARLFGFNPPGGGTEGEGYSYENWVTVPEDMKVPAPLVRKRFPGGLYAAYTIQFPDFHEWEFLKGWAKSNERYQARRFDDEEGNPASCLEEHLNWVYSAHAGWPRNGIDGKIDLLLPVSLR